MKKIENKMLIVLGSRELYSLYREHVPRNALSPTSEIVLGYMDKYWSSFPDETIIDWDDFQVWIATTAGGDPNVEAIKATCEVNSTLLRTTPSLANGAGVAADIFKATIERYITDELAEISESAKKDATRLDTAEVRALLELHDRVEEGVGGDGELDSITVSTELKEILEKTGIETGGLAFSLPCLSLGAGPLRAGDNVVVAARPEVGKTTFLVHQLSYMVKESETASAVIFSNEESGERVALRLYQSVLGWTTKQILDDPAKAEDEYNRALAGDPGRIRIVHGSLSRRDCERAIEKYKPDIIGINMLQKIGGFRLRKSSNDIELFAAQGIWTREIASGYNLCVLSAWQAGASAQGQAWIEQDDIYQSKTGIVAEADLIIGIGDKLDPMAPECRYIHLSKNKLTGDGSSDPRFRHGYFDGISILPEIGQFKER